ncbi:MAG: hypothetical protein R3D26_05445 [Cyanobacteriota/Melainabacteria group bacterium]
MKAPNAELDKGHTAVARVQNDRTGNSHYIYVAGRDNDGNYIIGDPDRRNKNKGKYKPRAPEETDEQSYARWRFRGRLGSQRSESREYSRLHRLPQCPYSQ